MEQITYSREFLSCNKVSVRSKTIFLFLKAHKNKKTGLAFPSYDFICEKLAISRKVLSKDLINLEYVGLIKRFKVKNKEGFNKNLYKVYDELDWINQLNVNNNQNIDIQS